jgi:class III poly(R)-hydroxyalkanoic acid synthase PhaE subunit
MSDTGFWNNDWLETQQKYWQAWTDMSQKAMGMRQPVAAPWEKALDHWWQAVSPAAPDLGKDFMGKMLDQGKAFFRMTEELSRNLGQERNASDWSNALEKTFADMQRAFGGGPRQGDDALHKMMAFWEMPFDNWQRMVSSLSLTPGDALRNMPHDQVKEQLNRFLSAPGLGYTREEQGQYQELMQRGLEYQKALQDYMQFFSNLGIKSVDRVRSKLDQLEEEEKVVDSARGLYDLWVSSCEEVYAEQVMTPEYAQLHGDLVNALMALKQRMAVMVDESLGAMNMPTRSELRTLQDRLQETRRENKALRHDVDELKAQIATLQGTVTDAPMKKAPIRRRTTAKKAATKKPTK